jgi:hypothetical protein
MIPGINLRRYIPVTSGKELSPTVEKNAVGTTGERTTSEHV